MVAEDVRWGDGYRHPHTHIHTYIWFSEKRERHTSVLKTQMQGGFAVFIFCCGDFFHSKFGGVITPASFNLETINSHMC